MSKSLVVITGASAGIGAAIARAFSAAGHPLLALQQEERGEHESDVAGARLPARPQDEREADDGDAHQPARWRVRASRMRAGTGTGFRAPTLGELWLPQTLGSSAQYTDPKFPNNPNVQSNEITGGKTPASFEPTIDYVVTKMPRWTFEKFPEADETLTTQMKSVGEVMAIGRTFKEAFQKACRSLEVGGDGYGLSRNHLMKIVHDLGRQGLLQTTRGRSGGLRLGREATRISVGDVVREAIAAFEPTRHQRGVTLEVGEGETVGLVGLPVPGVLAFAAALATKETAWTLPFALVLVVKDFALWVWGPEDLLGPRAPGLGEVPALIGECRLTRANLQLAREEQQSILRFAELHGNETQALQAKIKIKELDLRLARDGAEAKASEANEIILLNSHDGTSSYQMLAGMFRFVCSNGLVCGDTVADVRVPHKGDVSGQVIEGAYEVLRGFDRVKGFPRCHAGYHAP